MNRTTRWWLRGVALAVTATGLTACSDPTPEGGGGAPQGVASDASYDELIWAQAYPVMGLDQARTYDAVSNSAASLALEGLTRLGVDGEVEPALAASVEHPDPLTYVYQLREGVTFWDGTPLTVDDVLFSLRRHVGEGSTSQLAAFWSNVSSIEESGDGEVTITLIRPQADFPLIPASVGQVTSKAFAEKVGDALGTPQELILGTGPYEVVEFRTDDRIEYARNEDYWGDAPRAEKVSLRMIPDNNTRMLALRSGEIDGAFYVPPEDANKWDDLPDASIVTAPGDETYLFSMNTSKPPFNDIHLRRAIAHAVNKDGIVERLFGGNAEVARSVVPRSTWSALADEASIEEIYGSLDVPEYDLDAARAELAKSAYPDGLKIEVNAVSSADPLTKSAQVLSQDLAELGIELDIKEISNAAWLTRISTQSQLGFETIGESASYPDPAAILLRSLSSASAADGGGNYAAYRNDELDRILEASGEAEGQERNELLADAMRIAAEDTPYVPIYHTLATIALADDMVYTDLSPNFWKTCWACHVGVAE